MAHSRAGDRTYQGIGLALCVLLLAGCTPPAQLLWSPDGRLAAYWSNGQQALYVIDNQGTILAELGQSLGGSVWSADSRTLYFASFTPLKGTARSIEEHERWLTPSPLRRARRLEASDLDANQHAAASGKEVSISAWSDGRITPLFRTSRFVPVYMDLSPDQNWMAILAIVRLQLENDDGYAPRLFVYSMSSRRLFTLSDLCGLTFCFTGPARLAYIQGDLADTKSVARGQLVEIVLDERARRLPRASLAEVVCPPGAWLCAAGDDIAFTGLPLR